jgi:carotenoid cleavage dioxygenase
LPPDLDGVALRVGPNASPDTNFNKKVNGIIDGDGMLHSVRLDGRVRKKALYTAGWFDTPRRKFEKEYEKAYFLRIGEMKGFIGILKVLLTPLKLRIFRQDQLHLGQANTALFDLMGDNCIAREFIVI